MKWNKKMALTAEIYMGQFLHYAENELNHKNIDFIGHQKTDQMDQIFSGMLNNCSVILIRYREKSCGLIRVLFAHTPCSHLTEEIKEELEIASQISEGSNLIVTLIHNHARDSVIERIENYLNQLFSVQCKTFDQSNGVIYWRRNRSICIERSGNAPNLSLPCENGRA